MTDFIAALQKHGLKKVVAAADGATLRGYLPTGNLALNWAISGKFTGGWPLGHVAEIAGDPSTGKSFLIARAIAEALKFGVALLDDTETAFNPIWTSTGLGVDTSKLAYPKPPSRTIEEHYDLVLTFIRAMKDQKVTGASVLGLDSVALLSTKEELEQGFDKENMKRAKQIKKLLRLAAQPLTEVNAAYLVTNHTIANIGDVFNPVTTGSGGGFKFQSTVRLMLRSPTKMKGAEKNQFVGVKINAFVEKNRLAPPWRQCSMIIPFYQPISPVSGLVDLLLGLKVLEKTPGHKLAYQGKDTGISAHTSDFWKQDASALDLLTSHPDLLKELEADKSLGVPKTGAPMEEDSEDES